MAILLVTLDVKARDYTATRDYLGQFDHCKALETVWLLDTQLDPTIVRDALQEMLCADDKVFVVRLKNLWASYSFCCDRWLTDPSRDWS